MAKLRLLGVALLAGLVTCGCMAPITPGQRLTEAARELNEEARFGRMDVAISRTSPGARPSFAQRRAAWGGNVRVVDIALVGISIEDDRLRALVTVDISWTRMDEGSLRTTRIAQVWTDRDGAWVLTRERRVAGDVGLFGERVQVVHPPSPDVHFASKTIR